MFKFGQENNAGIYLTISFHLIVLIILLISKIHSLRQIETSFIIDLSKIEEIEAQIKQIQFKESISKELDELLSQHKPSEAVRNVVVDASSRKLSDSKNSDASQLYDDIRKLQEKLDAAKRQAIEADTHEDFVELYKDEKNTTEESYKGPSVISYTLEGRKAMSLPIPAYKCWGEGDVVVTIVVNRKGFVTAARINENRSDKDNCIREYALTAAKQSRFTASSTANDRQGGEITYRFVAQ